MITKRDIIEKIALKSNKTTPFTREIIQEFIDTVTEELSNKDRVELRGFGVFEVKTRPVKKGT